MRRMGKFLVWSLAALGAIPVLLAGVVLIAANTGPGRRLIEAMAPRVTDGAVRIAGIAGRFPDTIRVRRLTVADRDGVWLTVNDATLDWSPRHLVDGEVSIRRLEAASVAVDRLPAPAPGNRGGGGFPEWHGVVSRLAVARLELGPAVAGRPVTLAIEGTGEIVAPDTGEAHLAVTASRPADGSPLDHYLLEVSINPAHLRATLSVEESGHGLIAGLGRLPDLGAISIAASVDGPPELADRAGDRRRWRAARQPRWPRGHDRPRGGPDVRVAGPADVTTAGCWLVGAPA